MTVLSFKHQVCLFFFNLNHYLTAQGNHLQFFIQDCANNYTRAEHNLSVSCKSLIICLSLQFRQIMDLLANEKSQYFAQPHPIIVKYFEIETHRALIPSSICVTAKQVPRDFRSRPLQATPCCDFRQSTDPSTATILVPPFPVSSARYSSSRKKAFGLQLNGVGTFLNISPLEEEQKKFFLLQLGN